MVFNSDQYTLQAICSNFCLLVSCTDWANFVSEWLTTLDKFLTSSEMSSESASISWTETFARSPSAVKMIAWQTALMSSQTYRAGSLSADKLITEETSRWSVFLFPARLSKPCWWKWCPLCEIKRWEHQEIGAVLAWPGGVCKFRADLELMFKNSKAI